ncbi:hypothetical protein [Streptomyces sp. NPDC055099]
MIGAGGALLGARIQAQATTTTAEATARAAVEAARIQSDTDKSSQTEAARRQTYAAFITTAHQLQVEMEKLHRDFYSPALDTREANRARDRIEEAASLVFLEGPEEVSEAAWEVYNEAGAGIAVCEVHSEVRAAWAKLRGTGNQRSLRLLLSESQDALEGVQGLWAATARKWCLGIANGSGTRHFPALPTHEHRPWGMEIWSHDDGPFGGARLVQMRDEGGPVPFYETVRPSSDVIDRLRASIDHYMSASALLVESETLTATEVNDMLAYALGSEHGATPEDTFARTGGDVANDILEFISKAQGVLGIAKDGSRGARQG